MMFQATKPFDCAIDLGTSNIVLTSREGKQFEMPSFVAIKKDSYLRSPILAMGAAAKEFHGRTGEGVDVIRPIARGVVAHQALCSELVRFALGKFDLLPKATWLSNGPRVLVSHPIDLSPVEEKAFARTCLDAGASKVSLVAEPLAAGAGVFEDHWSENSKMVVDFGGGVIEAVAFSGRGIIAQSSMRWGSDDIDLDIQNYLQQRHHLQIGPLSAEQIKHMAALKFENGPEPIAVRGFDLITRKPKQIQITCGEIKHLLKRRIDMLVQCIVQAFENIPEGAFEEISSRGLMITGGGARLKGFLSDLERRLNIKISYDTDPLHGVCRGEYRLMQKEGFLEGYPNLA